ncbi:MAG: hypothetical protein K2R93_16630 [Gemmatimonadaceae bacterium]|nr:hypothetical protein [Gemmatimonadaceae bacterium]
MTLDQEGHRGDMLERRRLSALGSARTAGELAALRGDGLGWQYISEADRRGAAVTHLRAAF